MLTKSTIGPFALRCLGIAAVGGLLNCNSANPVKMPADMTMRDSNPDLDPPGNRTMFVTSRSYALTDIATSSMTAASVLDDECRTLADNGGLHRKRKFRAWFSTDGTDDPASRFAAARKRPKAAYVLPNGRQVADSWDTLTSLGGSLNIQLTHSIDVTETGDPRPCPGVAAGAPENPYVWTNVQPNGVSAMQPTCVGKSQSGQMISASVGSYCARDANWTQLVDDQNDPLPQAATCGQDTHPIYCIEDEDTDE